MGGGSGLLKAPHRTNKAQRMGAGGTALPQIGSAAQAGGGGGASAAQLQAQQQKALARQQRHQARNAGPNSAAQATIEFTMQGGPGTASCGVSSIKGHKPGNPNWINQDNYSIEECVGGDPDTRIYIVLDGHGEVSVANERKEGAVGEAARLRRTGCREGREVMNDGAVGPTSLGCDVRAPLAPPSNSAHPRSSAIWCRPGATTTCPST
jgi:hypothetical protein